MSSDSNIHHQCFERLSVRFMGGGASSSASQSAEDSVGIPAVRVRAPVLSDVAVGAGVSWDPSEALSRIDSDAMLRWRSLVHAWS
jgi:hypothetical protein